jgi:ferredoxin
MFRYPTVSPTTSIVLNMITELPGIPRQATESITGWEIVPYSVYMDNYFSLVTLFNELQNLGCGACGTACPKSGILLGMLGAGLGPISPQARDPQCI